MRTQKRVRAVRVVGVLMALVLVAGCQPTLSGVEFKHLFDRLEPMPGNVRLSGPPSITGHAAADQRIRSLAVGRGYRLRGRHVGQLVTAAGVPVDERVAAPLRNLVAEARRNGHTLTVISGYRSIDLQRTLFRRRLAGYSNEALASGRADGAINAALMWVAPPGYSKHQTGYAVDFRAGGGSAGAFGTSPVGRWIAADNHAVAKRFGFIPSYPSGAGAQGPEPEPWEYVYVGTAAIRCSPHLARANDRAAYNDCLIGSPISRKYRSLGGAGGFLGRVVEAERAVTGPQAAGGRVARYQNGSIYWSPATSAREVRGRILTEFRGRGGVGGVLRYPTTDTLTTPDDRARYSVFQGGRIYSLRQGPIGAVTLTNAFHTKHQALGGVRGLMGYPAANVQTISASGGGQVQAFEKGRMFRRAGVVRQSHGSIDAFHRSQGGLEGRYGYPATDVGGAGDGRGRVQWFAGGVVWSLPAEGITGQGLYGGTLERYLANGHVAGPLGYPTRATRDVGDGRGTYAEFQRGRIYATAGTGGHQITGAILDRYLAEGAATGPLGYPVGEVENPGDGIRRQHFEGGSIEQLPDGTVLIS